MVPLNIWDFIAGLRRISSNLLKLGGFSEKVTWSAISIGIEAAVGGRETNALISEPPRFNLKNVLL